MPLSSLSLGEVLPEVSALLCLVFFDRGGFLALEDGCVACLFSTRLRLAAVLSLSSNVYMLGLALWYLCGNF